MKTTLTFLIIVGFLFHHGTALTYDDVASIYGAASFVKTVFFAASESKNLTEFWTNVDPQEKHQKFVEGKKIRDFQTLSSRKTERFFSAKLNEIQASISHINKTILKFSADLKRLEISVDIKHFNSHVKYRTKQIFHSVQRFFDNPSNSTRHDLIMQCHINPPNSILEVLEDILSENWLIEQSRHYKYESPALNDLIKKLDKIVEILAISEAACTSRNTMEDAIHDLKKMTEIIKQIHDQIIRSKDVIHKTYFNYLRTVVQEYQTRYSNYQNREFIVDLLEHLQTKYNYGPLYTIGVLFYYHRIDKTFEEKKYYGNLQNDFSFTEFFNNRSILVTQSPSLCLFIQVSDKIFLDSLIDTCTVNDSLTETFKTKCNTEYNCIYIPHLSCFYYPAFYTMYASNGGVCGYGENHVQTIITKPMPKYFVYQPLKYRKQFIFNPHVSKKLYVTNYNGTRIHKEKQQPVIFDTVEFVQEKLFMEQDFNKILSDEVIEPETPVTLSQPHPSSYPVLISKGGNKEKGYSNFEQGHYYKFFGTIKCANGKRVGKDATVNLIEIDQFSFDDTVTSSKVMYDGFFYLTVDSSYNDFPSEILEFKLQFEDCCDYWFDKYDGFLINDTWHYYTI